jgi:HicA toxin of bacterial toxin-antitoxin,
MAKKRKLLQKILERSGSIRFKDFVLIIEAFGFEFKRGKGSHRLYKHPQVPEFLNVQDSNGQAKPYQMDQFLALVEQYRLEMEDE